MLFMFSLLLLTTTLYKVLIVAHQGTEARRRGLSQRVPLPWKPVALCSLRNYDVQEPGRLLTGLTAEQEANL